MGIGSTIGDTHKLPPGMKLSGVTRIYLGVDTQIYRPREKVQARAVLSGAVTPEMFLFSCVKVNSMRAGFDTLLEAWAKYLEKAWARDPVLAGSSKLYLHTNVVGGVVGGGYWWVIGVRIKLNSWPLGVWK